jgi:hypothetical protein
MSSNSLLSPLLQPVAELCGDSYLCHQLIDQLRQLQGQCGLSDEEEREVIALAARLNQLSVIQILASLRDAETPDRVFGTLWDMFKRAGVPTTECDRLFGLVANTSRLTYSRREHISAVKMSFIKANPDAVFKMGSIVLPVNKRALLACGGPDVEPLFQGAASFRELSGTASGSKSHGM